jgi:hypothetical protein
MSCAKQEDGSRPCSAPILSKEPKKTKRPPSTAASTKTTPKASASKSNVSDKPTAKAAKKKLIKNIIESPLTSTGSLEDKNVHQLGHVPAYLKKAKTSVKSPSEKDVKPAVISEHERSHQLGTRPAYLTRRVTATAASELKAKRELFEKQRKQLEACQAQTVATFNQLSELQDKDPNTTDKLEWAPELKVLQYKVKKDNGSSHGDDSIISKGKRKVFSVYVRIFNLPPC